MNITVNERRVEVDAGTSVDAVRARFKPDADVLICNGAAVRGNLAVSDGDRVVLIRRGERPGSEEMEALLAARHSPGVHQRVKGAAVGIAGLGGLGSAVAIALARTGIGRLVLADFDLVEPSNLNRQQYFIDQLGMPKTEALQAHLARINPYVRVEVHTIRVDPSNVAALFGDADVLVEAFDTADAKAMLLESFSVAFPGKPLVMATGLAGYESSNSIRTTRVGKNLYVVGDLVTAAQPGRGLMAPRVGVAAHHQANAVLRILMGVDPVEEGTT